MTDVQDLVLDALVGATLGPNLRDSPLTVAARLFDGKRPIKFGSKFNDSVMSEIARRLGWPVLLVEGVQGGVRTIQDVEEMRRFAMTVFRLLPVGGTPPKLTKHDMGRAVAWPAIDIHPLVCQNAVCRWPNGMEELADSQEGDDVSRVVLRCETANAELPHGMPSVLLESSPNTARLLKVGEFVRGAFEKKAKSTAGYALREMVRLTVKERGISEAVALIVDIARRCGMATETL